MKNPNRFYFSLIVIIGLVIRTGEPVHAQQMYQFSQFMFNNYLINPAVVGTYNYFQVRVNSRMQWIGVPDAPITNAVTVYGPHSKLPMGYGGMVYYDMTGPTSRLGLMGSYAYNIPINAEMRFSAGLSVGMMMYRVDGTKFDLGDNTTPQQDPALLAYQSRNVFTPDANLGVYLYASHFYVGLSAQQLIGQSLSVLTKPIGKNQLRQSFYLGGGYLIYLTDDFELEPALVLKYSYPYPVMFDVNVKVTYQGMLWGGVSYRFGDAVSLMLGYRYQNRMLIGLSYDYSYTSLRKYTAGTYEIMLGYQFDKIK